LTKTAREALSLFEAPLPKVAEGTTELEMLNQTVESLLPFLPAKDSQVATHLVDLLACIDRLQTVGQSSATAPATPVRLQPSHSTENIYDTLRQDARSFRSGSKAAMDASSALLEVEKAEQDLLWGRIEDLLEQVTALCKTTDAPQAAETATQQYEASLSEYSLSDLPAYSDQRRLSDVAGFLPEYKLDEKAALEGRENDRRRVSSGVSEDKRQIELDGITQAIERLYSVSPQLANQRVDPCRKDRKELRELQLARLTTAIEQLGRGRLEDQRAVLPALAPHRQKGKERAEALSKQEELDQLLDAIGKGASANMSNQRVALRSVSFRPRVQLELIGSAAPAKNGYSTAHAERRKIR
jgi:hypothetical protein